MSSTLRPLLLAGSALLALPAAAQAPDARPQGGAVVAGQARITQTPQRTQVDQSSNRAVIEWRGFDIGANHQVEIRQPAASSWSLQRVTGRDPSAIAGRLTSNGGVAIVNPAGIVFHQGAQVDVAALIATTADTTNSAFMAGRLAFDGAPRPGARVENHGSITVRDEGLAALVGPVAANAGTIRARMGRVAIAGAEAVTIDLAGDGLLSFDVTRQVAAGGALATNSGTIAAEGGHVLLTAQGASSLLESVVEAGGRVTAREIVAHAPGGVVRVPAGAVLDASAQAGGGRVTVGAAPGSAIRAPQALAARTVVERGAEIRADATAAGPGGTVIVHSASQTRMSGAITARGAGGAPGGRVEVSSRGAVRLDGWVTVGQGGFVLIDPLDVRIVDTPVEASDIAASVVSTTMGSFVVEAERSITVLAEVDRHDVGPLTLRTTNATAAAGDGIFIQAPLRVDGDLRLESAGLITQDAGARIAASTLFAGGNVPGGRAAEVRLESSANEIHGLDGGAATGRFAVASARRLTVDAPINAGTIALTSANGIGLFAPIEATGEAALVATGSLGITQAASGAGISAAQLRTETPIGATVLDGAGNAVVALGDSETGGGFTLVNARALHLAGALNAAGTTVRLTVTAGDLTQETGVARINAARLAVAAPAGGVRLDSPANAIPRIAGSARDAIAIETVGALTVEGTGLAGASLSLGANGEIAQDSDALLRTASLRVRSAAGAVALGDPLNQVAALGASRADGRFVLSTTGNLSLTGLVEAPEIALNAAGSLTQAGGSLRTPLLRAAGQTGEVVLDAATNEVAELGLSGAGTRFALTTSGALSVIDDVAAGGALELRAASLALGAPIGAGTAATLIARSGDVVQTAGTLGAATLRAEATGEVRLDAAGNAIAAVAGRAGPLFRITTSGVLAADDIAAQSVRLAAGGAITQPGAGLGIAADLLAVHSPGAVTLGAGTNAIAALGAVAAPGGLVLRSRLPLELTLPVAVPSAEIGAAGLTQQAGATLRADTLRLDIAGDALLELAGNALPRLLGAGVTGDLRLGTAGGLALEGLVQAGGTLALQAGGSITQTAGRIVAPVLVAHSTGGEVRLERPGNEVGSAGGGATGGWRLARAGSGDLRIAGMIAAPEVVLTLAGGLDQGAGALRTDALALDVAGAVRLDGAGHRVAAIAGQAGSLRLASIGSLDVTGALGTRGEMALSAAQVGLLAPVEAGGRAMLVALAGDITQAGSGAALTAAGGLQAMASGAVALAAPGNRIARLEGGSAGGDFALATTGALAASGPIGGETVLLRAGGVLTLDGVAFQAGRAVLLAAPAGIAAGAQGSLAPLDPARLPVLVLDTRAAGFSGAIPAFLQPDAPGLAPGAQPVQLPQFGAASAAAAGAQVFDIAAGASPVFLLLDGGSALGAVEAGRLGLLAQGGTAFLVGTVGGVNGEAAATLAAVSGSGSYQMNACPMGLANCGAPPPVDGGGGGLPGGGGDGGGGAGGGGALPGGDLPGGTLPGGAGVALRVGLGPAVPPPWLLLGWLEQPEAAGSAAPPGGQDPWSPWPSPWPLPPVVAE